MIHRAKICRCGCMVLMVAHIGPRSKCCRPTMTPSNCITVTLQLTKDLAEPHAQECIEFAQAVVDGAPSPVPAEQSMQVMQILNAIYEKSKDRT